MPNRTHARPRSYRTLFEGGFAGTEFHEAIAQRDAEAQRRLGAPAPDSGPGWVRLIHGANEDVLPIGGQAVGMVRREFGGLFSIAPGANAFLDGDPIEEDHLLRHGETLEFIQEWGRKGVGNVWTREEFCTLFKMSESDLDAMIAKGLPVHRMEDGSIRITETQVDEFLDQQAGNGGRPRAASSTSLHPDLTSLIAQIRRIADVLGSPSGDHEGSQPLASDSPYLDLRQAASYLRKSPKAIYGLIERGKLKKMPGSHICYFTREMLDSFLRGGTPHDRNLRPGRRKKG